MPNDIEFSGERKRVRCNEGLGPATEPSMKDAPDDKPQHDWTEHERCEYE